VQKYDKPFEATSSSVDALNALGLARKSRRQSKPQEQLAWLQRAVELDPNFASGYAALSVDAFNRRQTALAAEYARKAFDLRDQVTEREKFYIIDKYYGNATGQLEEQLQSGKLWAMAYPRDYNAFASLNVAYGVAGQYDKALEASLEAIRLDPDATSPYGNAMGYYAALGRLDDAKRIYEEARKRNVNYRHLPVYYYDIAFLRRDPPAMEQAVRDSIKLGAEDEVLVEMALAESYSGKLRKSGELVGRAVAVAQRANDKSSMAASLVTRAHLEAICGLKRQAQQDAADALKLDSSRDVLVMAGWSFARSGDAVRAQAAEKELQTAYPLHTIVNRVFLPVLRAELENSRNRPDQALAALEAAVPYELTSSGVTRNLYAVYVRGESYLRAHQGQAALKEFQKILDAPGIVMNSPLTPLARLGLARAYALLGDRPKSRDEYVIFITTWSEADSDLPILMTARQEAGALR
jgi:tetratricopeptide (TPR) repeat protein